MDECSVYVSMFLSKIALIVWKEFLQYLRSFIIDYLSPKVTAL